MEEATTSKNKLQTIADLERFAAAIENNLEHLEKWQLSQIVNGFFNLENLLISMEPGIFQAVIMWFRLYTNFQLLIDPTNDKLLQKFEKSIPTAISYMISCLSYTTKQVLDYHYKLLCIMDELLERCPPHVVEKFGNFQDGTIALIWNPIKFVGDYSTQLLAFKVFGKVYKQLNADKQKLELKFIKWTNLNYFKDNLDRALSMADSPNVYAYESACRIVLNSFNMHLTKTPYVFSFYCNNLIIGNQYEFYKPLLLDKFWIDLNSHPNTVSFKGRYKSSTQSCEVFDVISKWQTIKMEKNCLVFAIDKSNTTNLPSNILTKLPDNVNIKIILPTEEEQRITGNDSLMKFFQSTEDNAAAGNLKQQNNSFANKLEQANDSLESTTRKQADEIHEISNANEDDFVDILVTKPLASLNPKSTSRSTLSISKRNAKAVKKVNTKSLPSSLNIAPQSSKRSLRMERFRSYLESDEDGENVAKDEEFNIGNKKKEIAANKRKFFSLIESDKSESNGEDNNLTAKKQSKSHQRKKTVSRKSRILRPRKTTKSVCKVVPLIDLTTSPERRLKAEYIAQAAGVGTAFKQSLTNSNQNSNSNLNKANVYDLSLGIDPEEPRQTYGSYKARKFEQRNADGYNTTGDSIVSENTDPFDLLKNDENVATTSKRAGLFKDIQINKPKEKVDLTLKNNTKVHKRKITAIASDSGDNFNSIKLSEKISLLKTNQKPPKSEIKKRKLDSQDAFDNFACTSKRAKQLRDVTKKANTKVDLTVFTESDSDDSKSKMLKVFQSPISPPKTPTSPTTMLVSDEDSGIIPEAEHFLSQVPRTKELVFGGEKLITNGTIEKHNLQILGNEGPQSDDDEIYQDLSYDKSNIDNFVIYQKRFDSDADDTDVDVPNDTLPPNIEQSSNKSDSTKRKLNYDADLNSCVIYQKRFDSDNDDVSDGLFKNSSTIKTSKKSDIVERKLNFDLSDTESCFIYQNNFDDNSSDSDTDLPTSLNYTQNVKPNMRSCGTSMKTNGILSEHLSMITSDTSSLNNIESSNKKLAKASPHVKQQFNNYKPKMGNGIPNEKSLANEAFFVHSNQLEVSGTSMHSLKTYASENISAMNTRTKSTSKMYEQKSGKEDRTIEHFMPKTTTDSKQNSLPKTISPTNKHLEVLAMSSNNSSYLSESCKFDDSDAEEIMTMKTSAESNAPLAPPLSETNNFLCMQDSVSIEIIKDDEQLITDSEMMPPPKMIMCRTEIKTSETVLIANRTEKKTKYENTNESLNIYSKGFKFTYNKQMYKKESNQQEKHIIDTAIDNSNIRKQSSLIIGEKPDFQNRNETLQTLNCPIKEKQLTNGTFENQLIIAPRNLIPATSSKASDCDLDAKTDSINTNNKIILPRNNFSIAKRNNTLPSTYNTHEITSNVMDCNNNVCNYSNGIVAAKTRKCTTDAIYKDECPTNVDHKTPTIFVNITANLLRQCDEQRKVIEDLKLTIEQKCQLFVDKSTKFESFLEDARRSLNETLHN